MAKKRHCRHGRVKSGSRKGRCRKRVHHYRRHYRKGSRRSLRKKLTATCKRALIRQNKGDIASCVSIEKDMAAPGKKLAKARRAKTKCTRSVLKYAKGDVKDCVTARMTYKLKKHSWLPF